DCSFCIKGNLMFEEDRRDAEDYMLNHKKCALCYVLVGENHYSATVDERGGCGTCENMEVLV
ncbi:hypothetical protein LCGC14_2557020, partial [marine sediment metagenome]